MKRRVFFLLMNSGDDITGPINLGRTNEITMLELAGTVIKLTESKSKIIHENEEEIVEYVNSQKDDFSFYRSGISNYEIELPQYTITKLNNLAQKLKIGKNELLRRLIIKVVP